jgi:type II secretory pathway pseudopilin PulG
MAKNTFTAPRSTAGFSLVELLVTMVVFLGILLGVFALFEQGNRISRAQIQVADLQQAMRVAHNDVVRFARMAGRGGLPRQTALDVRNNALPDDVIAGEGTPPVLDATDVLVVRGVLATPLYQAGPTSGALVVNLGAPTTGAVTVSNPGPTAIPQDLAPLRDAIQEGRPEAILIVSGQGEGTFAVVQLDPSRSSVAGFPISVTVGFRTTAAYDALSTGGTFQPTLSTVSHVGILEEHRFYIEERYETPGGDLAPILRRDRYYPNTQVLHPATGGPLADNVMDLQIAFGLDVDGDEQVTENPPASADTDEWQGNHAADAALAGALYYLRITTLGRTDRRDKGHVSAPAAALEDHNYGEAATPAGAVEAAERMYRRRVLVGTVDLRNLF